MNKKIASLVYRSARPYKTCLRLARCLLAGFLIWGLMEQADAGSIGDCAQDRMAVDQKLAARMPADPRKSQTVLHLRREGVALCHKGAIDAGRAKLQEAASRLDPHANEAMQPQR